MKKLQNISNEDFAKLAIFIQNKVLGTFKYPYPSGLDDYQKEVIQSIRHIAQKETLKNTMRKERLEKIITIEFLPYFVIKWLEAKGYSTEND
jgi:hypothetical protein